MENCWILKCNDISLYDGQFTLHLTLDKLYYVKDRNEQQFMVTGDDDIQRSYARGRFIKPEFIEIWEYKRNENI